MLLAATCLGPPTSATSGGAEASVGADGGSVSGGGTRGRAAVDGKWWSIEVEPGFAVPTKGQLWRADERVGFAGRLGVLRNRAWRGFYLATGPTFHYAFFRARDGAVLHAPTLGGDGRIGGAHRYFTIYAHGSATGGFFVFDEPGDAAKTWRPYGRLGLGGGFSIFPLRWLALGAQADYYLFSSVDVVFTIGFHFGRVKDR